MLDVACTALPIAGERTHADVSVRAGGSAANAAVAASAAGAVASVIGRIGTDPAAEVVVAALAERGVDTTNLARDAALATGVTVACTGEAPPAVVASRGANVALSADDLPATIDADALFVSGYALFQEGSAGAADEAMRRCEHAIIGIDVASPRLAQTARERLAQPAPRRVVFATAEEAHVLTGEQPEQAARMLAANSLAACVKLGANGAITAAGAELVHRKAAPVDRRGLFGAGDAFAGAFLVALAGGAEIVDALGRACRAGATAASGREG